MKNINTYINEAMGFKLTRNYKNPYNYRPKDKNELIELIKELIKKRGIAANLNDIDTSAITDMSYLFTDIIKTGKGVNFFKGDISSWDVSNVKDMSYAFNSLMKFNNDLSDWDVSNVENMEGMFGGCTEFEGNGLDKWNVRNTKNMEAMFNGCAKFNFDLSTWNVNNVENMGYMFVDCKKFKGKGLYKWNVSNVKNFEAMFMNCSSFCENLDSWGKLIDFNKIKRSKLDAMFNYVKAPNKPQWYLDFKNLKN